MKTVEPQAVEPDDWPELISSPVLILREGGQWAAVLTRFSVVGRGDTRAEAWTQMDELARDYLEAAEREGLPFGDVLRHMPRGTLARFWSRYLIFGVVLRPLTRNRRPAERRFVLPHSHHAAAC